MTRSRPVLDFLVTVILFVAAVAILAILYIALALMSNGAVAAAALCFGVLVYFWLGYAFLKNRAGRQAELLVLLTASVESNVPLGPAVQAYAEDRPQGPTRTLWEMLLSLLVFPGFYFLWHTKHRFDARVRRLAALLDEGMPLAEALRSVPALASREVRLAVAVGEQTGQLAECLRRADRERPAAAWLEVVPRLVYPLVLLTIVLIVILFLSGFVIPRYKRIFQEFGSEQVSLSFPRVTRWLIDFSDFLQDFVTLALLAPPAALLLGALMVSNPTARWYLPVIRWAYRPQVQGEVLRLLGSQVAVGRPAPDALWLLAEAEEFPPVVRRALGRAGQAVDRGEPFVDALFREGLMPKAFVPLARAAEQTNTLAWTLGELGDHLAGRSVRTVRRLSMLLSPVCVLAIGALVGFVVLGMFMPLLSLMEHLTE